MKVSIVRMLASLSLCAMLAPISLQAQMPGTIHVTVPFPFTAGSRSFEAGEYRVWQITSGVLAIGGADGSNAKVFQTHILQPNPIQGDARMTFNKYGDRYFLSRLTDNDYRWDLPKSAVEKELMAKAGSAKPVVLVAGK